MSTSESLTNLVREVLTHHILEVSSDPMFIVDGDHRVLLVNRAATQLGWTEEQLVGRHWDDLVADSGAPSHILSTSGTASTPGVALARTAQLRRRDGTLEAVRLVTYRLWLGSTTAPSVVIAERRSGAATGRRAFEHGTGTTA